MLILTRHVGESVMIDDQISVTVITTQGGEVQIGIDAPRALPIHRQEIHERLVREARPETRRIARSGPPSHKLDSV